jgi:hypothetical protein
VERAVTTALEPWRIEVIALPGNPAGLSLQRARAVAEEQRAGAVIWVAASQDGHVLHLYDAHSGQVMSRALPSGPPFSEPVAASLALSIKTMLRHGPLAPAHGRGPGAWAEPDLIIDSRIGLRMLPAQGPELRFGLALVWTPRFKGSSYSVAARVDTGLGVSLDVNNFVGNITDIALGMEVLRRIHLTRRIEVDGLLGGSLHRTYLLGLIGESKREAEVLRWHPSADAGLVLRARLLSGLYAGAHLSGSYFPRRENYVLYGMPIISSPRYAVEAGVGLGIAIRW